MSQLEVWRSQLGEGAVAWASAGRHAVEPGRWVALSGVPSTHVNAALCWTSELESLSDTLSDIAKIGAKAVVMLTGPALASAQVLVDKRVGVHRCLAPHASSRLSHPAGS